VGNESLHETIATVQQAEGCGLVIKQHSRQPAEKGLLTPEDWKAVAHLPDSGPAGENRRFLEGQSDSGGRRCRQHRQSRHLHNTIIDYGYDIASMAKAHLHVISAHPSPMLSPADRPSSSAKPSKRAIANSARRSRRSSTSTMNTCIVAEGPADVLIPFMVHKLQAAVTVIGTVARRGFPGR
jgi:hypothetical protein